MPEHPDAFEQMATSSFGMAARTLGLKIVESAALPLGITPGEEGRRIVRHGMADVLAWLGEDPGPAPDHRVHSLITNRTIIVSSQMAARLRHYGASVGA